MNEENIRLLEATLDAIEWYEIILPPRGISKQQVENKKKELYIQIKEAKKLRKESPNFRKTNCDCCLKCKHRNIKDCDLYKFFIRGSLCNFVCDSYEGYGVKNE